MKENQIYIHYGHKKFSKEMYEPIKNMHLLAIPNGGLWASRIDAKFGWKDWYINQSYKRIDEDNAFKFKLKDGTKILYIDNIDMLSTLPVVHYNPSILKYIDNAFLDFEKLSKEYDAIEVSISKCPDLFFKLYEWYCDTILIMNPNIIEEIKQ